MTLLRQVWDAKGSILLAFVLAVVVWVAAVSTEDPTTEQQLDTPIPIEYSQPKEGLLIVGSPARQASITLRAPQSIFDQITPEDLHIRIDLSQLDEGTYQITLQPTVDLRPAQIVAIEPATVTVSLEAELTREIPIEVNVMGEPALGYDNQEPSLDIETGTVTGPMSAVNRVDKLVAQIDIEGARQTFQQDVSLMPVNSNGARINNVQFDPGSVTVTIAIEQGDRYRLVSVIPTIEGSAEYGYRITSIQVVPDQIILTSSNTEDFEGLGGFVETEPIDLTGARETLERRAGLNLPEGLTPVGNQSVLVRVTITPILDTRNLEVPVEFQGLAPGLAAQSTPQVVTVLLTGPLAILESLEPDDVRVVLNLVDYEEGSYVLTPEVIVPPTEVEAQIVPDSVEVTIGEAPPATQTPVP